MADARTVEKAIFWLAAAMLASFPVLVLFLLLAPNEWDYRIGIALGEVVGLACLAVSPFRRWNRGLCMAAFVPIDIVALYYITMCIAARLGTE